MESTTAPSSVMQDASNGGAKRKRSPSTERAATSAPPAKAAKTHSSHLQINYLVRQFSDTLPLLSVDDTLPSILQLISDYNGVLERHESLAGNLGARPLGPILIKRFERLFEGPPRVLKTHGKEGTTVTWLDVVEFARHKPEQFNLEKMRDGVRVCQIYTKQSRVEISEEDFVLISSGIPQKLIPPQPIAEDEEKELGTLEIMERNVGHVIQLADQVSARARQLNHRLKNRKNAIISRREAEASSAPDVTKSKLDTSSISPDQPGMTNGEQRESISPTSGFVAVNLVQRAAESGKNNGFLPSQSEHQKSPSLSSNGKAFLGPSASPATRAELLNYFTSARDRSNDPQSAGGDYVPPGPSRSHKSKTKPQTDADYANILLSAASPVPIPNTPSNLVHYTKPSPADRYDDSGPYKAEMLSRMDSMQRGDRVMPPCDRCRRLHMDCLKNLTACLGCTKKHAKCSWKDVTDQELLDNPYTPHAKDESSMAPNGADGYSPSAIIEDTTQGVRDEELLGEDLSDDGKELTPSHTGTDQAVSRQVPQRDSNTPPQQQDVELVTALALAAAQSAGDNSETTLEPLESDTALSSGRLPAEALQPTAPADGHLLDVLEHSLNGNKPETELSPSLHQSSAWTAADDESKSLSNGLDQNLKDSKPLASVLESRINGNGYSSATETRIQ